MEDGGPSSPNAAATSTTDPPSPSPLSTHSPPLSDTSSPSAHPSHDDDSDGEAEYNPDARQSLSRHRSPPPRLRAHCVVAASDRLSLLRGKLTSRSRLLCAAARPSPAPSTSPSPTARLAPSPSSLRGSPAPPAASTAGGGRSAPRSRGRAPIPVPDGFSISDFEMRRSDRQRTAVSYREKVHRTAHPHVLARASAVRNGRALSCPCGHDSN